MDVSVLKNDQALLRCRRSRLMWGLLRETVSRSDLRSTVNIFHPEMIKVNFSSFKKTTYFTLSLKWKYLLWERKLGPLSHILQTRLKSSIKVRYHCRFWASVCVPFCTFSTVSSSADIFLSPRLYTPITISSSPTAPHITSPQTLILEWFPLAGAAAGTQPCRAVPCVCRRGANYSRRFIWTLSRASICMCMFTAPRLHVTATQIYEKRGGWRRSKKEEE